MTIAVSSRVNDPEMDPARGKERGESFSTRRRQQAHLDLSTLIENLPLRVVDNTTLITFIRDYDLLLCDVIPKGGFGLIFPAYRRFN